MKPATDPSIKKPAVPDQPAVKRGRGAKPLRALSAADEARALAFLAGGATIRELARAFQVSKGTIERLTGRPGNREYVAGLREQIKGVVSQSLARIAPKSLTRLEQALDNPQATAKDLDALSRSALNIERIGQGVSGENRQQPTTPGAVQIVVSFPPWAQPLPVEATVIESEEPAALALPPSTNLS